MKGSIIAFRLPQGTDTNTLNKFVRGFYGQDSTSWRGRYSFHRHGLLEEIPHRKFIRGVIIVNTTDVERVIQYLNQYSAEYYNATVMLTPHDVKALR